MSRIYLVETDRCTGCGACVTSCPVNCITMREDMEGFLQPKIDSQACVKCHSCERVCPILNKEIIQGNQETKVYAAINKDEVVRAMSSSGGLFYALAKLIIERKGVVFGARFDDRWEVMHSFSETLDGVIPFMGSKYVQSCIGDSYKYAKKFLEQGRWVLFSGTPCQLGGLRAYLGKEYERLIQVDLICHGVPSPMVWRGYLKDFFPQGEIVSISFRDKNEGWLRCQNVIVTTITTAFRERQMENLYYKGFVKNVYLRKSCYNCQYRSYHRNTDITMGDYWGVDRLCPKMFDDKGTSIVFTHSVKGDTLLLKLNNEVELLLQSKEDAVASNPSMDREDPKSEKRERFFRWFKLTSFRRSAFVIDKDTFLLRANRKIRKLLKK